MAVRHTLPILPYTGSIKITFRKPASLLNTHILRSERHVAYGPILLI